MKIKFLLINAIDITKSLQTSLPPLSLGYLVSSLREKYGNDLIDFRIIDRDVAVTIRSYKPDIVGITSVSQNFNFAVKYAKIAKKHKIPVLVGGTHVTVLPSSMTRDMDVAVLGEGEEAIKELLEIFLPIKKFVISDLKKLKGLAFWDGKKVVQTEVRAPIMPMDAIPVPRIFLQRLPISMCFLCLFTFLE